ncbi:MAG: acetyltransferase [Phycisphaerales bacterium]
MGTTGSIYLIGGGGHAKVVADAAALGGRPVAGIFDDQDSPPACVELAIPHLGPVALAAHSLTDDPSAATHIAMGSIDARARILSELSARGIHSDRFATIIHPAAIVAPSVAIGRGVFIAPAAVINPHARIADHAIINTGAIIEHDVAIGENAHIAPRSVLCGQARVGDGVLIGAGAVVIPLITIEDGATVGAGAVVVRPVARDQTVVGTPARAISR